MGDAPCLHWPGRTWVPGHTEWSVGTHHTFERTKGTGEGTFVFGDVLDAVALLHQKRVKADLVYVDPPYASQADYAYEARLDGRADGRTRKSTAYEDKWRTMGRYLDEIAPRLEALASLLSDRGSIWVHLDWRASYLVRVILDEIMGPFSFKNEIVWRRAPNLGRQAASGQFGRTIDTIVVYAKKDAVIRPPTRLERIDPKSIRFDDQGRPFTSAPRGDYTDASIAELEKIGRVHRTASGKVYIKYFLVKDDEGHWCRERRVDALWTDVPPLRHAQVSERTGYPTQKPRALLERIIRCATPEDGVVVDLYGGSGTTGEAAHACGRTFVIGDRSPASLATSRARLLRAGAALTIERVGDVEIPRARARITREDRGTTLVDPKEPLAWALGSLDNDVFCTQWHAERALGARVLAAPTLAPLSDLKVRVYQDDGTIAEAG